ncbi:MAG TPA: hypothetical protein VL326_23785 [Kofleriaceae bacterium]|nr:hypothetical protein [Kofleriaceae bacterium]
MIATTRSLIVLAVIAAILGVLVLVVKPRDHAIVDRSIAPSFDAAKVTKIEVRRPNDKGEWPADVSIVLEKGKPTDTSIDPAAVDSMFTALRAGRWHRRAPAAQAGAIRAKLAVSSDRSLDLAVGAALPGSEQTWIVRGPYAYLVDGWVVHALAPTQLDVHVRRPFAMTRVTSDMIRKEGFAAAGSKARTLPPVAIKPEVVAQVQAALDGIELVDLAGTPDDPSWPSLMGVTKLGQCSGGRVFVEVPTGKGCIEKAAWDAVEAAIAALSQPPEQLADPQLVSLSPIVKLWLPDRHELFLDGRPHIDNGDADTAAVDQLLTVLATPGTVVPLPESAATDALVAVGPDQTQVQLQLYAGLGVIARRGEPVAIKLDKDSYALIARTSAAYHDPTRWREDATTITSIVVDRVTYERGAVLGEWTRKPAGTIDNALVDALAQTLAIVRAPGNPGSGKTTNGRKIKVTFTPPAGPPSTHELLVSGLVKGGCRGRADKTEVILSPELCTAAAALHP